MQVLPDAIQAAHVLNLLSDQGTSGFEELRLLASMPLALFDFSFLDKALFMKMQPGLRAALFAGLLAAVNVLRELVAAYSLAQSQVRVQLAPCTSCFVDAQCNDSRRMPALVRQHFRLALT